MGRVDPTASQNHRLTLIRNDIAQSDEVFIRTLARKFKVSEMTIRRDLVHLEELGEVIRTHGGATTAKRLTFEFTFRTEQQKNIAIKRAIAKRAMEFVRENQTLILDTGTTVLELARRLATFNSIKVITVSLPIISELQFAGSVETILLGGHLRPFSPDLYGALTEQNLAIFRADIAFLGAGAFDAAGNIFTEDLRIINLNRAMTKISKKVVVLADSSKFERQALCKLIGPESYDVLITDSGLNPKEVRKLSAKGIQIITVSGKEIA
jgi:DeoR/GlpR family transcriptional regulator of sugar metabolism